MKSEAKYAKEKISKNIHRTAIEQYDILLKETLGSPWPHVKDECLSRNCFSQAQLSKSKSKGIWFIFSDLRPTR